MRKSRLLGAMCAFTIAFVTLSANAALVSRLGGQAVYDTDLNITWLADGLAATGSAFDDGALPNDGLMTWDSANAWAASLSVGGVTWRLASARNPDGSICSGPNCTDSAMGHLFYTELSGTSGLPIVNSGDPDLALFTNINTGFWLSTELSSVPTQAYIFVFGTVNSGIQTSGGKTSNFSALAMYDGDVSAVPVPAAVWLFGSGLLGLVGMARCKKSA